MVALQSEALRVVSSNFGKRNVAYGHFVANGKRFCTKGRRPLVFRIPIRNVPFSIRYICVNDEGRNLTFVPRAEGPWFVGAGRRLFVDICTIESGRDPTNYY